MDEKSIEALRYPTGKFKRPERISLDQIQIWIDALEAYPAKLQSLVQNLDDSQLDTAYRPGGWTIRQVVHHVADSHHNSYTRFKWALTEEQPVIKPYEEKGWAGLHDSLKAPLSLSLDHLRAVHAKLVYLLHGLDPQQLERIFIHPEGQVASSLAENIGRYVWHGKHHYMHIRNACLRQGWL